MGKRNAPTRKSSRGLRGRSHSRRVRPIVVLAVEGETEKKYLNALNQFRYGHAFHFDFCRTRSKSSLKNLIDGIRDKVKREKGEAISGSWIVCDVDKNETHLAILNKWLAEKSEFHHGVVLSNPCIEAWFVYHCVDACSSWTASSVLTELERIWEWGAYKKGMEVPDRLIEKTDAACSRVNRRRASFAEGATAWHEAPWTDMPEFIAWLDQVVPRRSE